MRKEGRKGCLGQKGKVWNKGNDGRGRKKRRQKWKEGNKIRKESRN